MLICSIDEGLELHHLEQKHVQSLLALDPGDLSFSQGEWVFASDQAEAWIGEILKDAAAGTGLESEILKEGSLIGYLALHEIHKGRQSAVLEYALDGRFRRKGIMTRCC
jgi:RimJ/RimL family protein N-acetyltransferase